MGEFTPNTRHVRAIYAIGQSHVQSNAGEVEFDRWLAAHDRQVRAQALRDAADRCYDDSGEGTRVAAWLRDRADAEERGE